MKFSTKHQLDNGQVKQDGVLIGRVVNDPKILAGREDKKDVAYFRVANNLPSEPVFYDVTVIGDPVKRVEKLKKGTVVALKGEFGSKEEDGKTQETLIASLIESF